MRRVPGLLFLLFAFPLLAPAQPVRPDPAPMIPPAKADAPAAQPKGKWREVSLPDGGTAKLVPREQMRIRAHGTRTLTVPKLKALAATVPAPPATFDWTKGNTIAFPILGNDQYGDCYYAAMAHAVQAWSANARSPVTFDRAALVARYKKLSGGDNGLSDYDVFGQSHNGEFYGGVVGPNGPHKILDHLVVDPADDAATAVGMYYFGGLVYTASLCSEWQGQVRPGVLWDAGHADPNAGHAIILTGKNAKGNYSLQTWGLNPPVEVTPRGIRSSDPELIVCFSLEWFDPDTGKAPNGLHYSELSALWQALGGRALPPNPFPGPAPAPPVPPAPTPPAPAPPGPTPVPGAPWTGTITYTNGVVTGVAPGAPPKGVEEDLRGAGVSPALILDVLQLLSDIRAKKGKDAVLADLLKILADLQ